MSVAPRATTFSKPRTRGGARGPAIVPNGGPWYDPEEIFPTNSWVETRLSAGEQTMKTTFQSAIRRAAQLALVTLAGVAAGGCIAEQEPGSDPVAEPLPQGMSQLGEFVLHVRPKTQSISVERVFRDE